MSTKRDRLPGTEEGWAGRAVLSCQPGQTRTGPLRASTRPGGRAPALPARCGCETKAWEGNRGKKKGLARGQLTARSRLGACLAPWVQIALCPYGSAVGIIALLLQAYIRA